MKIKNVLPLFFALAIIFTSCSQKVNKNVKLKTNLDSLSYSIGVNVGVSLQANNIEEINYEALYKGLINSFEETDIEISSEDARKIITANRTKLSIQKAEKNLEEGNEFLAKNKEKKGVFVTDRGLQYEILKEGTGKTPTKTDTVIVHYTGTLIDGTVFSSIEKNKPFKTAVGRVLPGWIEGLQLMKEGAKYKFYIPTELAYGTRVRRGGTIEPNMALIFEVELLEVIDGPKDSK